MIRADRREWLWPCFIRLLHWQMRRRFHGVFLKGKEHLAVLDPARPVVACANHTNWWDGYAAAVIGDLAPNRRVYFAQEERHLRRYAFHRWVGAFGVDLDGTPLAGLRHALELLGQPDAWVWMFPQGRIDQPETPIGAKGGATFLAGKSNAQIVPVAFRYDWLEESRPGIYLNIGKPLPSATSQVTLANALQSLYNEVPDQKNWAPLFPPRLSITTR